jgi:hypothetical protein
MKPYFRLLIPLIIVSTIFFSSCHKTDQRHALNKSLNESVNIQPSDSAKVKNFYSYLDTWNQSLLKDSIPDEVVTAVRNGNFVLLRSVQVNYKLFILVIQVGSNWVEAQDSSHPRIDNNQKELTPLSRLRDAHYLITLVDDLFKPYLSTYYLLAAYTPIEISSLTSSSDSTNMFYYLVNESSFGGGYSLVRLIIKNIENNSPKTVFDKPVIEHNSFENSDYHYMYELSPQVLRFFRVDDMIDSEWVEKYKFNGKEFIQIR